MASKTRQELLDELAAAIRSGGTGGKTTAEDVRGFLSSLIEEIIARSEESALPAGLLAALAGASGTPSGSNPFVTSTDTRLGVATRPAISVTNKLRFTQDANYARTVLPFGAAEIDLTGALEGSTVFVPYFHATTAPTFPTSFKFCGSVGFQANKELLYGFSYDAGSQQVYYIISLRA